MRIMQALGKDNDQSSQQIISTGLNYSQGGSQQQNDNILGNKFHRPNVIKELQDQRKAIQQILENDMVNGSSSFLSSSIGPPKGIDLTKKSLFQPNSNSAGLLPNLPSGSFIERQAQQQRSMINQNKETFSMTNTSAAPYLPSAIAGTPTKRNLLSFAQREQAQMAASPANRYYQCSKPLEQKPFQFKDDSIEQLPLLSSFINPNASTSKYATKSTSPISRLIDQPIPQKTITIPASNIAHSISSQQVKIQRILVPSQQVNNNLSRNQVSLLPTSSIGSVDNNISGQAAQLKLLNRRHNNASQPLFSHKIQDSTYSSGNMLPEVVSMNNNPIHYTQLSNAGSRDLSPTETNFARLQINHNATHLAGSMSYQMNPSIELQDQLYQLSQNSLKFNTQELLAQRNQMIAQQKLEQMKQDLSVIPQSGLPFNKDKMLMQLDQLIESTKQKEIDIHSQSISTRNNYGQSTSGISTIQRNSVNLFQPESGTQSVTQSIQSFQAKPRMFIQTSQSSFVPAGVVQKTPMFNGAADQSQSSVLQSVHASQNLGSGQLQLYQLDNRQQSNQYLGTKQQENNDQQQNSRLLNNLPSNANRYQSLIQVQTLPVHHNQAQSQPFAPFPNKLVNQTNQGGKGSYHTLPLTQHIEYTQSSLGSDGASAYGLSAIGTNEPIDALQSRARPLQLVNDNDNKRFTLFPNPVENLISPINQLPLSTPQAALQGTLKQRQINSFQFDQVTPTGQKTTKNLESLMEEATPIQTARMTIQDPTPTRKRESIGDIQRLEKELAKFIDGRAQRQSIEAQNRQGYMGYETPQNIELMNPIKIQLQQPQNENNINMEGELSPSKIKMPYEQYQKKDSLRAVSQLSLRTKSPIANQGEGDNQSQRKGSVQSSKPIAIIQAVGNTSKSQVSVGKEIFIEKEFLESELERDISEQLIRDIGVDKKSFEQAFASDIERTSIDGGRVQFDSNITRHDKSDNQTNKSPSQKPQQNPAETTRVSNNQINNLQYNKNVANQRSSDSAAAQNFSNNQTKLNSNPRDEEQRQMEELIRIMEKDSPK
ncbi:hypothetical protein FGO68_gene1579 [Halteria grandinella]|uniref:Uncharacterized protein n=1 Tax=Halteria grandinella TaxID=5974 RepID=A0A8J8P7J3_HALGN|nr:hypothetical protein FGO68_gene1579 [Halteria grandinella]